MNTKMTTTLFSYTAGGRGLHRIEVAFAVFVAIKIVHEKKQSEEIEQEGVSVLTLASRVTMSYLMSNIVSFHLAFFHFS